MRHKKTKNKKQRSRQQKIKWWWWWVKRPQVLFKGPEARQDLAHSSLVCPPRDYAPWASTSRRRRRASSCRLTPRKLPGCLAVSASFGSSPITAWGPRSAFLAQNIERAGERKVWSRLARWEGSLIGVGDPTKGCQYPARGMARFPSSALPSGASREMQMTRLSPLCRGDKDLSCRFHNSSTVYIHHGRHLTQSCSEMILFFPYVVSVIIASGAERKCR